MTWTESWQRMDPYRVLERKQERAARTKQGRAEKAKQGIESLFKEPVLDQDTSERIEELLVIWYLHEQAYSPALGAPRVSPSCRGYQSNETQDDGDDRDAVLNRIKAESVAACIDDLHYLQRAAINVTLRNKVAGMSVHRNARVGSVEDTHKVYQEAKVAMLPGLKRRELV